MKNVSLEVLTAPGCVHCREFLEYWKTISAEWPTVALREISLITPEGQELMRKHRIFSSPGVLLDGELFSSGAVNKERLLERLKVLSVA